MANFEDIPSNISIGASQSVRRNAGNTDFEAFTPMTGLTVGSTPVSGGTNGSVLFVGSSNVQQDNSNLFYDDTTNRLGVGLNTSLAAKVHTKASSNSEIAAIFQAGGASPSVNTLEVRQADGDTVFSVTEDAIGGIMNIHGSNGAVSGFFKTNSGGVTSGMDLGVYDILTLWNRNTGSVTTSIQSRGGTGIPAVNWEVHSGQDFNFTGYAGLGGRVKMRDRSNDEAVLDAYLDSSSGNRGIRFPKGKFSFGFDAAASAKVHIIDTAEQLRIGYDGSNYLKITVANDGATEYDIVGTNPVHRFKDNFEISDGKDFVIGSTAGTKFGDASSKWSFGGYTPSAQSTGWDVINFTPLKVFDGAGDGQDQINRVCLSAVAELITKGILGQL